MQSGLFYFVFCSLLIFPPLPCQPSEHCQPTQAEGEQRYLCWFGTVFLPEVHTWAWEAGPGHPPMWAVVLLQGGKPQEHHRFSLDGSGFATLHFPPSNVAVHRESWTPSVEEWKPEPWLLQSLLILRHWLVGRFSAPPRLPKQLLVQVDVLLCLVLGQEEVVGRWVPSASSGDVQPAHSLPYSMSCQQAQALFSPNSSQPHTWPGRLLDVKAWVSVLPHDFPIKEPERKSSLSAARARPLAACWPLPSRAGHVTACLLWKPQPSSGTAGWSKDSFLYL